MFSFTFKAIIRALQELLGNVSSHAPRRHGVSIQLPLLASWLPTAVAETLCARRIETLVSRLVRMRQKILIFLAHVRGGHFRGEIDDDDTLRVGLAELKEDMRALRCQVVAWQTNPRFAHAVSRLKKTLAQLGKVSEDVHTVADQLLWEIAEYDARRGTKA